MTESERSGERLLEATRRLRGSESINRISENFGKINRISGIRWDGRGWWIAAEPLWRVTSNWWRVDDDVECWILNGGLADEEPLQRILN